MRKLYLVNELGATYFFDYRSKTLVESLSGLGFDYEIEYLNFDAQYVESKRTLTQRIITLDLVFLEGYKGFNTWINFISKSHKLRLFYESDGIKYCYVNVSRSAKSQLEAGVLKSQVELEALSLWLKNKNAVINVIQTQSGKIYPYRYTYVYAVSFNGKINVNNESARSIPLKIKITGNVFNPRVLIRQNGEVVTGLRLLLDERDFPTIEISSDPTRQYMHKRIGDEVSDIYADQDFTYDNFIFLPPGISEVFFDPGVREVTTCEISYAEEYLAH